MLDGPLAKRWDMDECRLEKMKEEIQVYVW
jgi:hypothetical protein